jgi:hypothetical protein
MHLIKFVQSILLLQLKISHGLANVVVIDRH